MLFLKHCFCLFGCVLSVGGISLLTELSFGIAVRTTANVLGPHYAAVLCVDDKHRHLLQPLAAPGDGIPAQSLGQDMTDQRLRTAAAGLLFHARHDGIPVTIAETHEAYYLFLVVVVILLCIDVIAVSQEVAAQATATYEEAAKNLLVVEDMMEIVNRLNESAEVINNF